MVRALQWVVNQVDSWHFFKKEFSQISELIGLWYEQFRIFRQGPHSPVRWREAIWGPVLLVSVLWLHPSVFYLKPYLSPFLGLCFLKSRNFLVYFLQNASPFFYGEEQRVVIYLYTIGMKMTVFQAFNQSTFLAQPHHHHLLYTNLLLFIEVPLFSVGAISLFLIGILFCSHFSALLSYLPFTFSNSAKLYFVWYKIRQFYLKTKDICFPCSFKGENGRHIFGDLS